MKLVSVELDTWVHDGTTRHPWVADVLDEMLAEPQTGRPIRRRTSVG
jgi:hypothetical protein